MGNEKRFILFFFATILSFVVLQYVMEATGLQPPPAKPQEKAGVQAKADPAKPAQKPTEGEGKEKTKDEDAPANADEKALAKGTEKEKGEEATAPAQPKTEVAIVPAAQLVLGSAEESDPAGYHLRVQFKQRGAGVVSLESSLYDAEHTGANLGPKAKRKPLQLIQANLKNGGLQRQGPVIPSFALAVRSPRKNQAPLENEVDPAEAEAEASEDSLVPQAPKFIEAPLAEILWEVALDDQGRTVRPISKVDPKTKAKVEGQEVVFRTEAQNLALKVTKRFRLFKGEDGFTLTTEIESPEKDQRVSTRLFGPHGIPIEGEWYTSTYRDIFFGQVKGESTNVETRTANDIAKAGATPFDNTALPLAYAGVENQYFTVFVSPDKDHREGETIATVIPPKPADAQKADISFEIISNPEEVGPNRPFKQEFTIFAGPKTHEALAPFGAEELLAYRKYQWFSIPGATSLARYVISPLLDHIYALTKQVAGFFGGKNGNYGIAIILLTLLVRMIMFPLGRKQAIAAKKMQDLQPLLKDLQVKYKDDKERQTKETFALYKKHGVNPVGGCLPALIQLPIFVGLWQALNNSVHLRHASFLYIQNLAAPDMMFKFPFEGGLPLLGEYFNLLPFLVVTLMLVQTKLFSPPATTPEAQMQQNMMKYMMIFMALMFYKLPSGLGIYFITSSLWQISERLLLPKTTGALATKGGDDEKNPPNNGRGGSGPGGGGRGGDSGPAKPPGRLAKFLEKVMDEASKDPTYRKLLDEKQQKEKEQDRNNDKRKSKARPGRRG